MAIMQAAVTMRLRMTMLAEKARSTANVGFQSISLDPTTLNSLVPA
jgi:hypothetical protein